MILTNTVLVREPANPIEAWRECQLTEHEPLPLTSEQVEAMAIAARMHLDCLAHEYYRLEARLSELLASIACVEA